MKILKRLIISNRRRKYRKALKTINRLRTKSYSVVGVIDYTTPIKFNI